MDSAELVVLMIVVPLAAMLVVAWGVRGPSLWTILSWQLVKNFKIMAADKNAKALVRFRAHIEELITTAYRLPSNLVDTGQMRPSMREPQMPTTATAARADGEEGG